MPTIIDFDDELADTALQVVEEVLTNHPDLEISKSGNFYPITIIIYYLLTISF